MDGERLSISCMCIPNEHSDDDLVQGTMEPKNAGFNIDEREVGFTMNPYKNYMFQSTLPLLDARTMLLGGLGTATLALASTITCAEISLVCSIKLHHGLFVSAPKHRDTVPGSQVYVVLIKAHYIIKLHYCISHIDGYPDATRVLL
jgi:hypothetical protein